MLKNSKVVVLAGGLSSEREISLRSGRGCFNALRRLGYNVSLLDLEKSNQIAQLNNLEEIDIAFLCTHGSYGEDGKLQGTLEWCKIAYTGSKVLASALCMNKYFTKQILKANNIQVPSGCLLRDVNKNSVQFPVMLKLIESGSSIGVSKINNLEELEEAMVKYYSCASDWMIEEYIKGREITVSLLQIEKDLKVLPILELKSKNEFYDLEAKYTKGLTEFILPAPFEDEKKKEIELIALKTFRALGCSGFGRVDMIICEKTQKPIVLEVNTLPGMTETSDLPAQAKAAGIEYDQLVELMLKTAVL